MRSLLTFVLLSYWHFSYSQENDFNYFPKADEKHQVIHFQNYSVGYSEEHEQAAWVAYELTKEEVETKVVSRTNDYREDPNCPTGSATLEDYKYSGFDRGHLAPAADFVFCPKAMSECFFMTNMSPQRPSFNRDIWLKLEVQTRSWASENKQLYVLVGGVLENNLQSIGANEVAVPNYYYKILLDHRLSSEKAIAFLMKNQASSQPLQSFVVPIDSIERLTGLDFFPELEDDLEAQLESSSKAEEWFKATEKEIQKTQCRGIAKSTGKRCRITFGLTDNYCRHHQGQRE